MLLLLDLSSGLKLIPPKFFIWSVQRYTHVPLCEYCEFKCTMGHKSHDPCFHKIYMEEEVMTFVAYCTPPHVKSVNVGDCFTLRLWSSL